MDTPNFQKHPEVLRGSQGRRVHVASRVSLVLWVLKVLQASVGQGGMKALLVKLDLQAPSDPSAHVAHGGMSGLLDPKVPKVNLAPLDHKVSVGLLAPLTCRLLSA
jgi:hypothetical protein